MMPQFFLIKQIFQLNLKLFVENAIKLIYDEYMDEKVAKKV